MFSEANASTCQSTETESDGNENGRQATQAFRSRRAFVSPRRDKYGSRCVALRTGFCLSHSLCTSISSYICHFRSRAQRYYGHTYTGVARGPFSPRVPWVFERAAQGKTAANHHPAVTRATISLNESAAKRFRFCSLKVTR